MSRQGATAMVVYGDLVLMVNFVVDGALLLAAARLAGVRARAGRVLPAAVLGAAYALGFYYWPDSLAYALVGKVAASALMVVAAFAPRAPLVLLRLVGWLWLSAALVAGLTLAIQWLDLGAAGAGALGAWQAGGWPPSRETVPWWALAGALGALALMAAWLWQWRRDAAVTRVRFTAVWAQGRASCAALVDTGNRLRDPLSAAPVVVVEAASLGGLLPGALQRVVADTMAQEPDWRTLVAAADEAGVADRIRLVPFGGVGHKGGLLVAVRVDMAEVRAGTRCWRRPGALVALAPGRLDSAGAFAALVPPEWVEGPPAEGSVSA